MKDNIIQLTDISKQYKLFFAVDRASLTVNKGDIYGLIGKNGAGKTTLFKLILGLTESTSGSLSILGSGNQKELRENRRNIGFFIGSNFYDYLNAHDNIEYYRKLKGIADVSETERVLKIVGLHGVEKPFKSYSMGMKQRLGIANAILGSPEIVILDEPVNGLDPQGILDVRKVIHDLNKNYGITFVISSHILSELDVVASRFGIIDHGVLLKEIGAEELHDGNQNEICVKTDRNEDAARFMAESLGLDSISIKEDRILLQNAVIEIDELAKELVTNDYKLYELSRKKESLEDYFFRLTGGGSND